jgi:hypothetical protein
MTADDAWPPLPLDAWQDTYDTLHLWTQIVGKTSLAFAPMLNHWWQVTLTVSPRGLRTRLLPYANGAFEIEFDFIDHRLVARLNDGRTASMPLAAQSVSEFYRDYLAMLHTVGVNPTLWPVPAEMADAIPFADDETHASYDPDAAQRWWRILVTVSRAFEEFRGRFIGKASPVHFFWGGFDLAYTRFSGRPAPTHPGGIPNCPDYVMIEAESHENFSAGWWPGTAAGPVREPAFYSYAYPEPDGVALAAIRPADARYDAQMREFILPYEAVRAARDPDGAVLEFLQPTYDACATLGRWDRASLERTAESRNT